MRGRERRALRAWFAVTWPAVALSGVAYLVAGGLHAALAMAVAVLLLAVLVHVRRVSALAAWLDAPERAPFPDARGAWGELLSSLARKLRSETKQLQRAEEKWQCLRAAMDAVPDGLLVVDRSHRIQWGNRAAEQHLPISLARDIGAVIEQLVRAPGFAEYLRTAQAAPFVLRTTAVRARVHELRVVPLEDGGRLLLSHDATDAYRVEAMRSEFVANVSHELRTPLTVVHGFLEHFAAGAEAMSADQRKQFACLMSDQAARMLRLVDDLLTLSRLESEDSPAHEEDIEMAELLAQIVSEAQSLSGDRHRIDFACTGGDLRGSLREVHSAFSNLISNAVRYTPAGGSVHIRWSTADGRGIFAVRDSGVGIAAEHLPRLTERFYRVDRGRSRDTGGTGLGLAIVKHILLRHQAALLIDSRLGEGSTFRAVFPAWRVLSESSRGAA